jgi:hypothetical protein
MTVVPFNVPVGKLNGVVGVLVSFTPVPVIETTLIPAIPARLLLSF